MKLGKMLFASGTTMPDPVLIASLLRQAGVNVPPSVRVTADVAQIIMSGGAVVNAIETGQKFQAFLNPSAATIRATSDIFQVCGLMDPNSPAARIIQFGTDLAMVVASLGANVLADISFALDVVREAFSFSPPDISQQVTAMADQAASRELSRFLGMKYATDLSYAQTTFLLFQKNKISIFEMLGKTAEVTPELFFQYYPEFKSFIPSELKTYTQEATVSVTQSSGLFGLGSTTTTETGHASYSYSQVSSNKSIVQNGILERYFREKVEKYRQLLAVFDGNFPRIGLEDLLLLSMMPPYFDQATTQFHIVPILLSLNLTPHDFGSKIVPDELASGEYSPIEKIAVSDVQHDVTPGLSFNGLNIMTDQQRALNQNLKQKRDMIQRTLAFENNEVKALTYFDKWGYTQNLVKNKFGYQIVSKWGTPMVDYPPLKEYISLISMWNYAKQDPYFNGHPLHDQFNFDLPSTDYLDGRLKTLQMYSVSRKMNFKARQMVAEYFNTTHDKISFQTLPDGTARIKAR